MPKRQTENSVVFGTSAPREPLGEREFAPNEWLPRNHGFQQPLQDGRVCKPLKLLALDRQPYVCFGLVKNSSLSGCDFLAAGKKRSRYAWMLGSPWPGPWENSKRSSLILPGAQYSGSTTRQPRSGSCAGSAVPGPLRLRIHAKCPKCSIAPAKPSSVPHLRNRTSTCPG